MPEPILKTNCPECRATLKTGSPKGFTPGQALECPKCQTYFAVEVALDDIETIEDVVEEKPKKVKAAVIVEEEDDDDDGSEDRKSKKKDGKKRKRRDDDDDERTPSGYAKYRKSPIRFIILGVLLVVMIVMAVLLWLKWENQKKADKEFESTAVRNQFVLDS